MIQHDALSKSSFAFQLVELLEWLRKSKSLHLLSELGTRMNSKKKKKKVLY